MGTLTTEALPEKLQRRIAHEDLDGCWSWTGYVTPGGYGRLSTAEAHRLVYSLLVGEIPAGLHLDHLCRNTVCVNPAHLEPVTPAENARRRALHKTTCPQGHPLDGVRADSTSTGGTCRYCKTCHRERDARARAARMKETSVG